MSLKKLLLLIFINVCFINYSQNKIEKNGEPRTFFPKYTGEKKWKFHFNFDARRSILAGKLIKFNGVRIGANYKGVHRFGIGLYSIRDTDKVPIKNIVVNRPDAHDDPKVIVGITITTLFYERVFYKTKRWEVSFPVYIGAGSANSEYRNNLDNYKLLKKDQFSVIGMGINTNYYILPWLYPKFGLGYRFAFNPDDKIASSLSKPFFALGLSINPIGAYKHFKKWRTDKKANQSLND